MRSTSVQKNKFETLCILASVKKTNLLKIQTLKLYTILRSRFCHFCWAQNTTSFDLIFCTLIDLIITYNKNFCPDFFGTLKCHIRIFKKKQAHWSPGAICRHPTTLFIHYKSLDCSTIQIQPPALPKNTLDSTKVLHTNLYSNPPPQDRW
jgi:hypothetical protein